MKEVKSHSLSDTLNEMPMSVQSNKTLIKASVSALLLATFVFVSVILPAEYNIDPLGTGKLLGLNVLANEPAILDVTVVNKKQLLYQYQKNEVNIIVPANKGVEYKFRMQQFNNITYEWSSQGKLLHFDFHGEPKGDTTGYFQSYTLANAYEMTGSMTVPFDGVHGWYWKNETDQDTVVTLKTEGYYEIVGLIH